MVGTISTLMILAISLSSVRLGQSAISWKPALEVEERSHSDLESPLHALLEHAGPLNVPIHPLVCVAPVCFPASFKFRNLPAFAATARVFLARDESPEAATLPRPEFPLKPFLAIEPLPPPPPSKVQWMPLFGASLRYLAVMHPFRFVTEAGTRDALKHHPFWGGYFDALGAMHGWSDGDGYYENYLGHPIQGAVSAYIWIHNDPRYRDVEFGKDPRYWKSRLRAAAFAWAFSEQFEIGLISEASIGQIQRYCCAYGFVDHVITPNGGMKESLQKGKAGGERPKQEDPFMASRPISADRNGLTWRHARN